MNPKNKQAKTLYNGETDFQTCCLEFQEINLRLGEGPTKSPQPSKGEDPKNEN